MPKVDLFNQNGPKYFRGGMLNSNLTKINVCKYESIKPISQQMGNNKRNRNLSLSQLSIQKICFFRKK